MRRDAPRIGVELALLGLVLASLGGSLGLIVYAHKRGAKRPQPAPVAVVASPVQSVDATPQPRRPAPQTIAAPEPTPVDLTPGRVAAITARVTEAKSQASEASERANAIESELKSLAAEQERWRDRDQATREAAAAQAREASRAEADLDALARERDVLVVERDATKTKIERERLRARDGVAVLPYKGPNGTWRRPIAIECRGATATLRPNGPTFTVRDLAGFLSPRSNPLVMEVARAMVRTRTIATPDGAASVPYLLFIVRPDGIRPFYAVRMILEPLGIDYGYELADADWDIEFPDLDNPDEWSEQSRAKRKPTWPPPPTDEMPRPGAGSFARAPEGNGAAPNGVVTGSSARPSTVTSGRAGNREARSISDLADLGAGRGDDVPNDGRIPWQPGLEDELPDFVTPPSSTAGAGREGSGTLSPTARAGTSMDQPVRAIDGSIGGEGQSSLVPNPGGPGSARAGSGNSGEVTEWPNPSSRVDQPGPAGPGRSLLGSRNQSLRDAIARNEGLVAPTMPVVPNRSGGGPTSPRQPSNSAGSSANAAGAMAGMPSGSEPGAAASGGLNRSGGAGQGAEGGFGGGGSQRGLVSRSLPITVACDRAGVTIHPGGATIPIANLTRDDSQFPGKLRAIVEAHQRAEPDLGFRPRVTFLVKPGGESTYLKARWQASVGTNYPQSFQIVDAGGPRLPAQGER